jgi:hypothetical protein
VQLSEQEEPRYVVQEYLQNNMFALPIQTPTLIALCLEISFVPFTFKVAAISKEK